MKANRSKRITIGSATVIRKTKAVTKSHNPTNRKSRTMENQGYHNTSTPKSKQSYQKPLKKLQQVSKRHSKKNIELMTRHNSLMRPVSLSSTLRDKFVPLVVRIGNSSSLYNSRQYVLTNVAQWTKCDSLSYLFATTPIPASDIIGGLPSFLKVAAVGAMSSV